MARNGVYAVGVGINGREAAMQATQHALDQLGAAKPALALVFFAQEFDATDVLSGLASLLGDTPLWGFSTVCPLTHGGNHPRSVVVALLAGTDTKASARWYPNYAQDSQSTARQVLQDMRREVFLPQQILIAADGINGSLQPVIGAVAEFPIHVSGCMAAGDPSLGKTYQLGGSHTGAGGLAVANLSGRFRASSGLSHGWHDLGMYYHATRTRDVWLHTLDGVAAAEVYARLFGYTSREWAFPPLTDMARQYPLGIEPTAQDGVGPFVQTDPSELLIRSILRVEVDGSLRLSAPVPEGAVVHVMAGNPDACVKAARQAVAQAFEAQESGARPLLALVLVDAAWQILFETRPQAVIEAISAEMNKYEAGVPLVGAYTYGQIFRPALDQPPALHNQSLLFSLISAAPA